MKKRVFIVWAMKSWSTSLYNYLIQHIDIYWCPIKEPNFFCNDLDFFTFKRRHHYDKLINMDLGEYLLDDQLREIHCAHVKNVKHYNELFKWSSQERFLLEASTNYLYSTSAAKNIKQKFPNSKILIILRNPIKRAYSHYKMLLNKWIAQESFIDELIADEMKQKTFWKSNLYIEYGRYVDQVVRYIDEFWENNVKVILTEDLKNNTQETLNKIILFLELQEKKFKLGTVYNVSKRSRSVILSNLSKYQLIKKLKYLIPKKLLDLVLYKKTPSITQNEYNFLLNIYDVEIKNLSKLLWRDLQSRLTRI